MLISAMVGIDLRNTLDMDATIRGLDLSKENLQEILKEIINIDVGDEIKFEILMIRDIREEEDYAGYRVTIKAIFHTVFQKFKIDITTGDVIVPKEIKYKFGLLFEDRKIDILAYNLETIISEKFEAIITKGIANTRARDYYDLYILMKFQRQNIDNRILKQAIVSKFKERKTYNYLETITKQIRNIENSGELKEIWKNYQNKFTYAKDISYKDVVQILDEIEKIINKKF